MTNTRRTAYRKGGMKKYTKKRKASNTSRKPSYTKRRRTTRPSIKSRRRRSTSYSNDQTGQWMTERIVYGKAKKIRGLVAQLYPNTLYKEYNTGRQGQIAGAQLAMGLSTTKSIDIGNTLKNNSAIIGDNTTGTNSMTVLYQPGSWDDGSQSHMYVEKINTKVTLASSITNAFKMEVYVVTPTRDIPKYGEDTGATGGMWNPISWFTRCLQAHQSNTGLVSADITMTETTIGMRPDNPMIKKDFCKYWKILAKRRYTMEPGRQVCLDTTFNVYREIQGWDLQTYTSLKGITQYYLVFANGVLVWANNASNALNPDTYGSCYVDWIMETQIQTRLVPFTRTKIINASQPGLMDLSAQGHINNETDAMVTVGPTIDN